MQPKLERIFEQIVLDLLPYLDRLVLIGGWVPYCYHRYVWDSSQPMVQLTTDVDLGLRNEKVKKPENTIDAHLRLTQRYVENHLRLGQATPYTLLFKDGSHDLRVPVEFLSDNQMSATYAKMITGDGIYIHRLDYLDFLIAHSRQVAVKKLHVNVALPSEAAYIFHKGITFSKREGYAKQSKDILSFYYMLMFSPFRENNLTELRSFRSHTYWNEFAVNMQNYFHGVFSNGILMLQEGLGATDWPTLPAELLSQTIMELIEAK